MNTGTRIREALMDYQEGPYYSKNLKRGMVGALLICNTLLFTLGHKEIKFGRPQESMSEPGNVSKMELIDPAEFGPFNEAAREAIKRVAWIPGRQGEQDVGAWVQVAVRFTLR